MESKETNPYKEIEKPQIEAKQGREHHGRIWQEIIS